MQRLHPETIISKAIKSTSYDLDKDSKFESVQRVLGNELHLTTTNQAPKSKLKQNVEKKSRHMDMILNNLYNAKQSA